MAIKDGQLDPFGDGSLFRSYSLTSGLGDEQGVGSLGTYGTVTLESTSPTTNLGQYARLAEATYGALYIPDLGVVGDQDISWSLWVDNRTGNAPTIEFASNGNDRQLDARFQTDDTIDFFFNNNSSWWNGIPINGAGWTHLVVTYNSVTHELKAYTSGVLRMTKTGFTLNSLATYRTEINTTVSMINDMLVDQPMVFHKVLTQSNIDDLLLMEHSSPNIAEPSAISTAITMYDPTVTTVAHVDETPLVIEMDFSIIPPAVQKLNAVFDVSASYPIISPKTANIITVQNVAESFTFDTITETNNYDLIFRNADGTTGVASANTTRKWNWHNAETVSSNVGALTGYDSAGYIYTEGSSPTAIGDVFEIEQGSNIDADANEITISFRYSARFSNSADVGKLEILGWDGSQWTIEQSIANVNNITDPSWYLFSEDFSAYTNTDFKFMIRYTLVAGTAWHHDFGIDGLEILGISRAVHAVTIPSVSPMALTQYDPFVTAYDGSITVFHEVDSIDMTINDPIVPQHHKELPSKIDLTTTQYDATVTITPSPPLAGDADDLLDILGDGSCLHHWNFNNKTTVDQGLGVPTTTPTHTYEFGKYSWGMNPSASQIFDLNDDPLVDGQNGNFYVTCWVKPSSATNTYCIYMTDDSGNRVSVLMSATNNKWTLYITGGSSTQWTGLTIPVDEWSFMELRYLQGGGTKKLYMYLNGVYKGYASGGSISNITNFQFYGGLGYYGIDDVRIFNRALTTDEALVVRNSILPNVYFDADVVPMSLEMREAQFISDFNPTNYFARWEFDTDLTEADGNYDGFDTNLGTPTTFDGSFAITKSGNNIEIPPIIIPQIYTASIWLDFTDSLQGMPILTTNDDESYVFKLTNTTMYIGKKNGGGYGIVDISYLGLFGWAEPHHILFYQTGGGNTLRCFIDNVERSVTYSSVINDTATVQYISTWRDDNDLMSDLILYDRPLNSYEIERIFLEGYDGFTHPAKTILKPAVIPITVDIKTPETKVSVTVEPSMTQIVTTVNDLGSILNVNHVVLNPMELDVEVTNNVVYAERHEVIPVPDATELTFTAIDPEFVGSLIIPTLNIDMVLYEITLISEVIITGHIRESFEVIQEVGDVFHFGYYDIIQEVEQPLGSNIITRSRH